MTTPKDLTQEQINTYIDCRLRAIESVLCEIMRGFDTDMVDKFNEELQGSTISPEIKSRMRDYNLELRNKYRPTRRP